MSKRISRRDVVKAGLAVPVVAALGSAMGDGRTAAADELATLDAVDQANLVKRGEVSPRELVEAAIRRIEAVNPKINAVIDFRFEKALALAGSRDLPNGPLKGVPTLVKDVAIAGEANYLGSRLLAQVGLLPEQSDEFTRRIERAGMIILGRTNVPELLSAPTTESLLHGPSRNPWNLERSVGGSSGGAGAAVAALMVPAAQASDGGGSTRIPASACGLVGLKPSRGRVSASPGSAEWMDITSAKSWVSRTVRDTALLLDVVAGPAAGDTLTAKAPSRSYLAETLAAPGKLRIGFMRQLPGNVMPLDPEALAAVERAASLLSSLGHHVEESHPAPLDTTEHFELIGQYWPIKVALRLNDVQKKLGRPIREDELEPGVFRLLQAARAGSVFDFGATLQRIQDYTRRMLAWYQQGFDLLLTPTTGRDAPPLGVLNVPGVSRDLMLWGGFAPLVNLTGQPAISLPLHWTGEGMPLGIQLVADIWREDLLVRVAAQLEQAQPWKHRLPPLHG